MSAKKHHVTLTEEQHQQVTRQSVSQKLSIRERKRARILLLADEGPSHEAHEVSAPAAQEVSAPADALIAQQVHVCLHTVERVRQRFAQAKERGQDAVEAAIHHAEQDKRKARILDGRAEAHLIALTCRHRPMVTSAGACLC